MPDMLTPAAVRKTLGLTDAGLRHLARTLGETRLPNGHRRFDADKVAAFDKLRRTVIKLQPSSYTDNLWATDRGELHEGTKLPYPFYVRAVTGNIERQDFWRGDPFRVVGFQNDAAVQRVDVWWDDVAKDPRLALGKYIVTVAKGGGMANWQTAVASVTVIVDGVEQVYLTGDDITKEN